MSHTRERRTDTLGSTAFSDYISVHKQAVYEKICEYVPKAEDAPAHSIMRDYIDRKGNYIRPGLVLLSGQMFDTDITSLLLPAAAIQISEDTALMQDDWSDGANLRRGGETAHRKVGPVAALNSSNIGNAELWHMLNDYLLNSGMRDGAKGFLRGKRMFDRFNLIFNNTVEGQHLENEFIHKARDLSRADDRMYYTIAERKTSEYTVFGPLQLGAIAADQGDSMLQALKEIGRPAGIAFQIVDDIRDITFNPAGSGKERFGDLYEGKPTLVMLHTRRNASVGERLRIDAIYSKP
ncbi:MAG: polyprenyl synthetase family protein, partial [Ktedonobacteraceae bacterium]